MNNLSAKNMVLIIAALLLWGVIGYKFIKRTDTSTSIVKKATVATDYNLSAFYPSNDTVELSLDYRDPFKVQKRLAPKTTRPTNAKKKQVQPTKKAKNFKWPSISYKGIIKNNETIRKVGLLTVNNRIHYPTTGSVIQDSISVFSIAKDSIGLSCRGHIKYYMRKKK